MYTYGCIGVWVVMVMDMGAGGHCGPCSPIEMPWLPTDAAGSLLEPVPARDGQGGGPWPRRRQQHQVSRQGMGCERHVLLPLPHHSLIRVHAACSSFGGCGARGDKHRCLRAERLVQALAGLSGLARTLDSCVSATATAIAAPGIHVLLVCHTTAGLSDGNADKCTPC